MVCEGRYQPSPSNRVLVEKSNGICRQIVIPAIDDALVLQCLSDALYADIKGKAPTKRSFFEPDEHKFSNVSRAMHGAPRYGSLRAWLEFQKHIFNFTRSYKYIIVTDVANYYDFISYTHLRNIIASHIDVRESVLDMLIFVLSGLLWQPDYMPRVEIGLPQIDIDASRILAHCFLYELDEYLEKHKKVDFVRYMDDIDVGVDSIAKARDVVRDIDLTLHTRQVRLNSGKTRILTHDEAAHHFRVRDNRFIDLLNRSIERKVSRGLSIERERRLVARGFLYSCRMKRFDGGNGEKILKRIVTIAKRIEAELNHECLYEFLANKPSCREVIISYLTSRTLTTNKLQLLLKYLFRSRIVDDSSLLNLAEALVEANIRPMAEVRTLIPLVVSRLQGRGFAGVYSAIWLASKYFDYESLYQLLKNTSDTWRSDPTLGRLVGGMRPLFINTRRDSDFRTLILKTKNRSAEEIYIFHERVRADPTAVKAIRSIVIAPNSSKKLGITHAKWLILLSVLSSATVSDSQKALYINAHKAAWADRFYRYRAIRAAPQALRSTIMA